MYVCVCVIFITCDRRTSDTHTHPFNGPLSGTTRVSRYQKGKTNLDFIEARDSEWQWHQLGHMQVCTLLQTDNHARQHSTAQLLQAGCPSCRPTNSVKALKAYLFINAEKYMSKCLHNTHGCVSAAQVRGVNSSSGTCVERRCWHRVESLRPVRTALTYVSEKNSAVVHYS